jgi:hypothetical protein
MADDMIASLMQEMGQQQGYSVSGVGKKKKESSASAAVKDTAPRHQLPELPGYPSPKFMAGSHSIWNPLVPGGVPIASEALVTEQSMYHSMMLPTNAQVEVMRRRVFEKFRQDATEMIQEVFTGIGAIRNASTLWVKRLPIPSMLEKWHMDAKRQETMLLMKQIEGTDNKVTNLFTPHETVDILKLKRQRMLQALPVYDPVLLSNDAVALFIPILRSEVRKAWRQSQQADSSGKSEHSMPPKFKKRVDRIQKGLYRLICEALESFDKQLVQAVSQYASRSSSDGKHRRRPKIQNQESSFDDDAMATVSFNGVVLKLHAAYLEKLQRLYDRTVQRCGRNVITVASFEEALFCLLCRYDMIQGAGLQAGVPGSVMDALLQHFDCRIECFASPLNCRYDRFASAFPDVDCPFGSLGSFFEWIRQVQKDLHDENADNDAANDGVCYQANPPFCDGVIQELSTTISTVISDNYEQKSQRPIMFVVFVPAWHDTPCYQLLLENEYLAYHNLLKQGDHWYAEGTRHRRRDSFRVASFDTCILFYQNEAARRKWDLQSDDCGKSAIEDLRHAFGQDPTVEESTKEKQSYCAVNVSSSNGTIKSIPSNIDEYSKSPEKYSKKCRGMKVETQFNTTKKNQKRKLLEQNEDQVQMNLLQSLGLSNGSNDADSSSKNKSATNGSGVLEFKTKTKKKKRRKKNKG